MKHLWYLGSVLGLLLVLAGCSGGGSSDGGSGAPIYFSNSTITLATSQTFNLAVTLANISADDVNWVALDANGGTFSNSNYTAPATPGTYQVQAVSKSDYTRTGILNVAVIASSTSIISFQYHTRGPYDLVKDSETAGANSSYDWRFRAAIVTPANSVVKSLSISRETGNTWDTFAGSGHWLLLPYNQFGMWPYLTEKASVFPSTFSGVTEFELFIEPDYNLPLNGQKFTLTLLLNDDTTKTTTITIPSTL